MAEAPKLEQAPSPTQQPGSTEALSSLIEKSRQDKRFDHAELDQVLAKYEAEKNNLNEQFSVKIGEEKSKADALWLILLKMFSKNIRSLVRQILIEYSASWISSIRFVLSVVR